MFDICLFYTKILFRYDLPIYYQMMIQYHSYDNIDIKFQSHCTQDVILGREKWFHAVLTYKNTILWKKCLQLFLCIRGKINVLPRSSEYCT